MSSQGSGAPTLLELANEVSSLVYELTRTWDARLEKAVAELRAREQVALTARQALAVWHLHEPRSMDDLAAAMACDQSNVTGLVDRLERTGLVERRADPADRRVRMLVLSEAGEPGERLWSQLDELLGAQQALRGSPPRTSVSCENSWLERSRCR